MLYIDTMNYNIDSFIERAKDMDLYDLYAFCQSEIKRIKETTTDYQARHYRDFVKEVTFFIGNGIKPALLDDHLFQKTKPIAENLVAKKQWKPEILRLYQP